MSESDSSGAAAFLAAPLLTFAWCKGTMALQHGRTEGTSAADDLLTGINHKRPGL